jgi:hypothetical protein
MKTMNLGSYFLSLAIMAFLLFSTGNAFAGVAERTCDHNNLHNATAAVSGSKDHGCTDANNFMVVAPYWQVDPGSYTFIAVSHTSLSGMASQIGLHISAITSAGNQYDSTGAETFTITSGNTERLFIAPSTHATVNPTSIPTAKFLQGTSSYTYGSIKVAPVMTHPGLFKTGAYANDDGAGFRDITMLSYWGSVIIEANTTGFAMEFIGDMNDSATLVQVDHVEVGIGGRCAAAVGCGGGKSHHYNTMSSGPNLQ